ncbi:MAG: hypothetical protein QME79_04615 [Bacillota bacterium]|nr:hypothetical protein [Bacillota bacterium]
MYNIEKTDYGYKLTFGGFIRFEEMAQWVRDLESALEGAPLKFSVFVDMRSLSPLPPDAKVEMKRGQAILKQKGLERAAYVLANTITTMQFQRIAKESGATWERHLDASTNPNWEKAALDWAKNGIDPER